MIFERVVRSARRMLFERVGRSARRMIFALAVRSARRMIFAHVGRSVWGRMLFEGRVRSAHGIVNLQGRF